MTLPDGTATTAGYDLAGRQTSLADLNAAGTTLRTESAVYNPDGQITSATNLLGNTATYAYDATGMLTSQTEPTSSGHTITVSYGYDLAGNRTALTDGNGNTTYTTYNSRGLPAVITEPTDRPTAPRPIPPPPTSTTATENWSARTCPAACRPPAATTRWAT
jgi:YD repeat-containing protein